MDTTVDNDTLPSRQERFERRLEQVKWLATALAIEITLLAGFLSGGIPLDFLPVRLLTSVALISLLMGGLGVFAAFGGFESRVTHIKRILSADSTLKKAFVRDHESDIYLRWPTLAEKAYVLLLFAIPTAALSLFALTQIWTWTHTPSKSLADIINDGPLKVNLASTSLDSHADGALTLLRDISTKLDSARNEPRTTCVPLDANGILEHLFETIEFSRNKDFYDRQSEFEQWFLDQFNSYDACAINQSTILRLAKSIYGMSISDACVEKDFNQTFYFNLGSDVVDMAQLNIWFRNIHSFLAVNPQSHCRSQIRGFADTVGSLQVNERLSASRAGKLAENLAREFPNMEIDNIQHYGEQNLDVPTADGVLEGKNRRAEVTVSCGCRGRQDSRQTQLTNSIDVRLSP